MPLQETLADGPTQQPAPKEKTGQPATPRDKGAEPGKKHQPALVPLSDLVEALQVATRTDPGDKSTKKKAEASRLVHLPACPLSFRNERERRPQKTRPLFTKRMSAAGETGWVSRTDEDGMVPLCSLTGRHNTVRTTQPGTCCKNGENPAPSCGGSRKTEEHEAGCPLRNRSDTDTHPNPVCPFYTGNRCWREEGGCEGTPNLDLGLDIPRRKEAFLVPSTHYDRRRFEGSRLDFSGISASFY
ncbi:unnamed protein product [Darwinula stevensoni]|uniref:Uncharacterized protein n=1 Tax=Darwinula stevensoni TaxID=69355 RepID=A0A7R8X4S1_9CRUS|nr:unnamed protein product [Darwinula stevensoni]CAG0886346.1 unnamed protein product [Darwinula stevensoni]